MHIQVYIEGDCVKVFEYEKCQGYGEMLRWTVEGKVAKKDQNSMSETNVAP